MTPAIVHAPPAPVIGRIGGSVITLRIDHHLVAEVLAVKRRMFAADDGTQHPRTAGTGTAKTPKAVEGEACQSVPAGARQTTVIKGLSQ